MEVLEENEEEERREEELMKALEISDELHDIETKLSVDQVCVPSDVSDFDWSSIDISQLPSSYKTNSPREKKLLRIADHYLQQYTHLCHDRKPLFLYPVNECGVKKFVSTTVRPTLLPYTELYHWDGCASFVCDYLTMEPLKSPLMPPSSLYSPTTILKYQRGNCFDFSVLLCSMLIGAGYDAYCVNGYATQDICSLDETLEVCPLLRKPQEVPKEITKKPNKYRVKSSPDLQSKFELQQEAKKKAETEATHKNKERGEEKVMEVEKPTRDPLCGLRVHAWVLVLSGKREVPEPFFINPFTGNSHSTMDEHFLGIESVWNHKNYWVNMQDCWNGCKDLIFDLGDTVRWEIMLSETDKPLQMLLDAEEENELFDRNMDDIEDDEEEEKDTSFAMPPTWVAPIQISPREFETRCSQGKKVIMYKKAKLEKWAPYLNKNGLVKRLTVYADLRCTEVVEVKEWFKNREDMLDMRELNKKTQLTTEYFSPGHLLGLKVHIYKSMEPETERVMEFYHESRVDGLQKRAENATEIKEYFVGRNDFKYFQHTEFGKRGKKISVAGTRTDINSRPIVQMKECFHRNLEKPADEDVAERVFLITEEMIQLTYHLKDKYITASKKEFFKPTENYRKQGEIMIPEMCITYQTASRLTTQTPREMHHHADWAHKIWCSMKGCLQPYLRSSSQISSSGSVDTATEILQDAGWVHSCIFMTGKMKFPLLSSLEGEMTAEKLKQILTQILPWTSLVTLFKSLPVYPADADKMAGSSVKDNKLLHLYKLLQKLTEEEKQLKQQVRQSEAEVLNILKIRENEEADIKLTVSIYDTERNEKRRQQYEAMKNAMEDEFPVHEEQDLDYLAPFLIQIGYPEKMTKRQALRLRDDCLTDFKNRLIAKANIIQARFEKEVEELKKKNQQFQENQSQLSREEEAAFLADYSETMFRIHILALRLNREKQTAPQKYLALEEKLRKDPRLAVYLSYD